MVALRVVVCTVLSVEGSARACPSAGCATTMPAIAGSKISVMDWPPEWWTAGPRGSYRQAIRTAGRGSARPLHALAEPGMVRFRIRGSSRSHGRRCRGGFCGAHRPKRSEEHTSELQSLMGTSYAAFCWKKKKKGQNYKIRPIT